MNWREVAVTVSSDGEEAVADLFYQLGCKGVSIDDPNVLHRYIEAGGWDYHDFGEVKLTGLSVVKGYFSEDEYLAAKLEKLDSELKNLMSLFPDWVIRTKGATLQEEDWASAWKAYFKPVRVGRHFIIKPSWEKADAQPEDVILELDPGMAFGTGTHPTTTLCLEMLESIVEKGMTLFDLGTGSGILAIAAAKLGGRVEAVDIDSVAVKVAKENVTLNQVEDSVKVSHGDLADVLKGQANIVVANIIADVIMLLLPDLKRIMLPDGEFLASGIIDTRAAEVEAAMKASGLKIVEYREDSGWVLYRARWKSAPV